MSINSFTVWLLASLPFMGGGRALPCVRETGGDLDGLVEAIVSGDLKTIKQMSPIPHALLDAQGDKLRGGDKLFGHNWSLRLILKALPKAKVRDVMRSVAGDGLTPAEWWVQMYIREAHHLEWCANLKASWHSTFEA